jgi:hypothetical protein
MTALVDLAEAPEKNWEREGFEPSLEVFKTPKTV